MESIYSQIRNSSRAGRKQLAVLIDPDGLDVDHVEFLVSLAHTAHIDYFFVGGSLIKEDVMEETIRFLKKESDIPCIIFPGSHLQVNKSADAILFLSLISGRNPDLLIGQQVIAAPYIKQTELEVLSTGYILIDGGAPTTASYISNTLPIPRNKPSIAASTAMAGEMLGHNLIYLDAGSGAEYPVSPEIVKAVREAVDIPIVVGGGIISVNDCENILKAGADIVVIGNAIEDDPQKLVQFAEHIYNLQYDIL